LERFGQVDRSDLGLPGQVGDRPGDLENAVVGASCQLKLGHRLADEGSAGVVEAAHVPYVRRPHVGVGDPSIRRQALTLAVPGSFHAAPDGFGRLAQPIVGEFLELDPRHVHVQVDPIEQRP
jgi:hypothetical protein